MKTFHREKFSVLLVLFLGYLGFSLVFPILPPMFLDLNNDFLPSMMTYKMRYILLGFIFAMYPMGQFFGCRVFGVFSDKYGRKPILLFTLLATSLMYVATALSVEYPNLIILFLARFFTGVFEGNISIATAVMADISQTTQQKTRNFGWIMTFASSGWVFGPFIGGRLVNSEVVSWFSFATPFWMGAIILFLCCLIVLLVFRETNDKPIEEELTFKTVFGGFGRAASTPRLRRVYITNFLFFSSIFLFFLYLPIWLIHRYGYGPVQIGNFEAYLSIALCLSPISYTFFSKHLPHKLTIIIACVGYAISVIPFILIYPEMGLWFTVVPISFFIALGQSFGTILISDLTSTRGQGEALGLNQSLMVLSETLAGIAGGFLVAIWLPLPFILSIVTALAAAGCIITLKMTEARG